MPLPEERSLPAWGLILLDSPGAEDKCRQQGQQVVCSVEFHVAASSGTPSLDSALLLPPVNCCSVSCSFPPRSRESSPETHKDRDRGFVKTRTRVRVSSGVMSPGSPAGMVQRCVQGAQGGCSRGRRKGPVSRSLPCSLLYLVTPVRTGADLLFPAPTEDRRGGRWQGPTSFSSN